VYVYIYKVLLNELSLLVSDVIGYEMRHTMGCDVNETQDRQDGHETRKRDRRHERERRETRETDMRDMRHAQETRERETDERL